MSKLINKIPPEVLYNARMKLDETMTLLEPYLVRLAPSERRTLVKMEAKSLKFLEFTHELAVEYPDLFPTFAREDVFREEFVTVRELWALGAKLELLSNRVCDAEMAAGTHTLETAEAFFQTVKIAARHDIPGARAIYEDLKLRFPSRRPKSPVNEKTG